jgi:hypothetical protein
MEINMKFPVLVIRTFKENSDNIRCVNQTELDDVVRDIELGEHVFEYSIYSYETRKVRTTSFVEVEEI